MDDGTHDNKDNDTDVVRWTARAELAKVHGISPASPTQVAFRPNWLRQSGNDDIARAIAALESSLAKLHDLAESTAKRTDRAEIRAVEAENRADRAEARVLAAEAEATASRERADMAVSTLGAQIEAERDRADQVEAEMAALRGQITAERELAVATQNRIAVEIETLRQRDRERRELGMLNRLWRAWRRE